MRALSTAKTSDAVELSQTTPRGGLRASRHHSVCRAVPVIGGEQLVTSIASVEGWKAQREQALRTRRGHERLAPGRRADRGVGPLNRNLAVHVSLAKRKFT